jgi:hypothetical protein
MQTENGEKKDISTIIATISEEEEEEEEGEGIPCI